MESGRKILKILREYGGEDFHKYCEMDENTLYVFYETGKYMSLKLSISPDGTEAELFFNPPISTIYSPLFTFRVDLETMETEVDTLEVPKIPEDAELLLDQFKRFGKNLQSFL